MNERYEKQNDMIHEVTRLRAKMVREKARTTDDLLDISSAFLNEALTVMITCYGDKQATEMLAHVVDEMRAGRNTKTIIHRSAPSTSTID